MKSKDILNQINEWIDPMDMINRGRSGPEMGGGGRAGGYIGGGGGRAPSMTPQSARELSPELLRTPAQVKPSKTKGPEEPIVKRETPPELTRPSPEVSKIPAQQRKEKAAAEKSAAEKSAEKEPVKKTTYTRDQDLPIVGKKTTTAPRQLTPQEKAEELLKGKGFKQEPGTVSGFKSKSQSKEEPAKAEMPPGAVTKKDNVYFDKDGNPVPTILPSPKSSTVAPPSTQRKTLGGDVIPPGYKWNSKTGKYDPPPKASFVKDVLAVPGGIKRGLTPDDKKSAVTSVGLHAALLAALANMDIEPKKSGAEKSQSAQQGNKEPLSVHFVDPGSQKAADAAATAQPAADASVTDGGVLPQVTVTAEPDKPKPKKKQPEKVQDPTRKAEEPKADTVVATDQPSPWEVEIDKDEERAEADKADDEESAKSTQATIEKPEEDEEDIIEKLKKLLGLDKNAEQAKEPPKEPSKEPAKEPAKEPSTEPEAKKDEPKPEPEKKPDSTVGKADAEKGDDTKKGDEPISFPKYKKDEKNELPQDTEKKGSDERTRTTDSPVDKGPAATGRDDAINWAPPPPERKYEPDDRATRLRDRLKQQMDRDNDVDFIDKKRMAPVNESIDRILGLSNITKKEIVESTMNLDMKTMLALISEASKMADIKGKKHTGKYGKEYDTDEEGDAKDKKAEPAEKKGRGRPKKDSNVEAGKYKGADDAASHVIGGKAPKGKSNLPSKKHTLKDWVEYTEQSLNESEQIDEKAVSKAQQKFMGMVHAAQKGKKPASKEVAKVAKTMGKKDAKDFAATKHKGLPEKVKEENYTVNKKPVSKGEYDANMKAAGKTPSPPEKVKEALKGGQKNLDVAEPKGKLDAKDFAKLRAKKNVKEGVNFAEMMKETQMGIEEMLEELQQEIAEFKATGNMGDKLRDAFDIHRHSKNKLMGEAPMMAQPMVEEPLEENPFTYAAKQAKASGEDSFKLGGETFPVKESQEEVDESGLQAYLGNKKYGKEGMDALRKAGREGASKEKMAKIRAKHDKMDEDGPGAARVYGDNEKSDFDVVDTMKKFANKGIDKWNEFEQGKKDRWDAALGGKSGYIPGTIPRFDTKDDNYPDEFNRGIKPEKELPPVIVRAKKEPESNIFDREKPYRDPKTGKMVTPPKGLSISEPIDKNAVDINKPRKSVKENFDFSLWDNQLEKMINESLTVTTTQGDDEKDNSVSITASGEKAAEIMALLRNAGMDSAGVEMPVDAEVVEPEQMLSAYGVPMSSDDEAQGSGMDDMLSLMKKLTGMGSDESDSEEMEFDAVEPDNLEQDYEEEDSEDEGEEEDQTEKDSDEEDSSDEEEEKVDEEYGQTDEGNAFTEKLKMTPQGGEFELDGKKYKDTSSLEEGEEGTCNECGMNEGECGHNRMDEADSPFQNENLESARPIEEELANGDDDTAMQDIKFLIKTLAGGLNKEKRDQTTLPHTAVKVTESKEMLNEWKKLSGIK